MSRGGEFEGVSIATKLDVVILVNLKIAALRSQ